MCSTLPMRTESLSCIEMPDAEPMDRYSHAIELSNACREFYQSRLQTAASLKQRWRSDSNGNTRPHTNRIDQAMEKLRQEMASLMDQDLSLMKQLLTLNEEIEQLKWRRRYCWSKASVCSSSGDLRTSSKDFSDSDMSLSQDELLYPSKSTSSSPCPLGSTPGETHFPYFGEKERESSFDSGIHEACAEPSHRPVLVTHL